MLDAGKYPAASFTNHEPLVSSLDFSRITSLRASGSRIQDYFCHLEEIMRLRWLLLVPLIILGCGRLPEGIGSNHEVMVLADPEQRGRLEEIIRGIFERKVFTAQEENVFTVRWGSSEEFDFYKKWKNLVLLASFDRPGPTLELLDQLLSSEAREKVSRGEAFFFARQNVWARSQEVFFLVAEEEEVLAQKLKENRNLIFDLMEKGLNAKIEDMLYAKGEQTKLEKRLFQDYGWTIRVPMGYEVLRELPQENFVSLRKQQPHRWIFVYWEQTDDVALTPEGCIHRRDEIGSAFYDGDQIVTERTSAQEVDFLGRRAIRLAGLWENKSKYLGGPFRAYCFYDESARRRYMVDAAVFAAGVEKEPYLRQVDIIAHTFSTDPLEVWE
jgi:hypothetical protein